MHFPLDKAPVVEEMLRREQRVALVSSLTLALLRACVVFQDLQLLTGVLSMSVTVGQQHICVGEREPEPRSGPALRVMRDRCGGVCVFPGSS